MTNASKQRIETFIDWFIRSENMQSFGSSSDDWMNDSERMQRCYDAAETGSDGSTHQEVIEDWRSAFDDWMRYDRQGPHNSCELFEAGVNAYFDDLELWHERNGSLLQEIG